MVVAVTVKLVVVVMVMMVAVVVMAVVVVVVIVVDNIAGEANSLHRSVYTQLKAVKGAYAMQQLGKGHPTKSDEFSEKFEMVFAPPGAPHFRKIIMQFFFYGYGCIYARRYLRAR